MATKYWLGNAPTVAQSASATFSTYNAGATVRTITIGGVAVNSVDSGGTLATSMTAFAVALNASTHPYFSSIQWVGTATQIQGSARIPGAAFVFAGSDNAGTCTNAYTVISANSGPNDWSVAANWSTGSVPTTSDTVIISSSATNICWGLSTGVTGLTLLRQELSYTGRIGLNYQAFATSADGTSVNAAYPEYRQCYLAIGVASYRHGDYSGIGTATGSPRTLIDFGSTTTCTAEIIAASNSSADQNRPAIRILGALVSAAKVHVLNVRSAPGGVGIAAEVPGETSAFVTINISDTTSSTKFTSGRGLSFTNFIQDGGTNVLQSDSTMTSIVSNGGVLRTEGAGALTTMTALGGTINHNSTGTTSTIIIRGGTVSSFSSAVARTWTTIQMYQRGTLTIDPAVISYTTLAAQERLTIAT